MAALIARGVPRSTVGAKRWVIRAATFSQAADNDQRDRAHEYVPPPHSISLQAAPADWQSFARRRRPRRALAQLLPRLGLMLSRIVTIGIFSLAALGISSCNNDCSGTYNCPLLTMSISLSADISGRVRSATGDTCTPTVDASGASIGIASTTMHPCLVRVVLDDGSTEESSVTFAQLRCCGYTVEATPFEPADGGATRG